ncbi:MAG TPA: hypothetical protein VFV50_19135 [Bdellovibrionales bacterium]|nr:hypothetical protein [Bdellovibrionales bacterium]
MKSVLTALSIVLVTQLASANPFAPKFFECWMAETGMQGPRLELVLNDYSATLVMAHSLAVAAVNPAKVELTRTRSFTEKKPDGTVTTLTVDSEMLMGLGGRVVLVEYSGSGSGARTAKLELACRPDRR